MVLFKLLFILLLCVFKINCEVSTENGANSLNTHSPKISTVINYLNSIPVRVYNYKEGVLINAHKKADITELTVDVSVDCINNYPNLPCNDNVLICNAFVQSTVEGTFVILGDVKCKSKPQIIVEDPTSPPEIDNINDNTSPEVKPSIALSNEAASSEAGDHFVAIHKDTVPCLGCPFDLNTDAEGVNELTDLALKHIESEKSNKHTLVKVLKLQQQIVSGVKYILLAEIAPTVCLKKSEPDLESCPRDSNVDSVVCQVSFIQKPWINKAKHIINNNCTVSQEFVISDDLNNEIDLHDGKFKPGEKRPLIPDPNFDHIAESGSADEMSPSRLSDLESQILSGGLDFDELQQPKPDQEVKPIENIENKPQPEQVKPEPVDLPIIEEFIVPDNAGPDNFQGVYASSSPLGFENTPMEDPPSTIFYPEAPTLAVIPEETTQDPPTEQFSLLDKFLTTFDDFQSDAPVSETADPSPVSTVTPFSDLSSSASPESVSDATTIQTETKPAEQKNKSSEESKDSSEEKTQDQKSKSSEESKESNEKTDEKLTRNKRAVRQLEKISPDEKNLVKQLADYAAAALDYIDDDNHKRIVLQILGAKKLVVDDGVYYHLILRMGISKCLEDKAPTMDENCRDKLLENYTKICKVQVHVNEEYGSPKVVKSQCQNIKKDKNDSNRTNYSRFRRNALDLEVVGGPAAMNKNDTRINDFLREGLTHLDSKSSSDKRLKHVEVISASSQVVAGALYKIKAKVALSDCKKNENKDLENCNVPEHAPSKVCEFQIWEKLWEHFREHTIKCDDDNEQHKFEVTTTRRRRDVSPGSGVPGGPVEINKDDERINGFLTEGLTHLDSKSSSDKRLKHVEVLSATSQVVAGSLYKIKAKVALSDCKKSEKKDLKSCKVPHNSPSKVCEFQIWEKPWEHFREHKIKCDDDNQQHKFEVTTTRRRRSIGSGSGIPGGPVEINKDDERINVFLTEGLTHLDSKSSSDKRLKHVEVLSATSQVVAGSLYKIKAKVALSDCQKSEKKDLENCNVPENAPSKVCEFQIWEKLWEHFREHTIKCDDDNEQHKFEVTTTRRRRDVSPGSGVPGGPVEINKDDERINGFLTEGLTHLDSKSSSDKRLKHVEVLSATSQVVAGALYKIKAKVALSDCKKSEKKDLKSCKVPHNSPSKVCEFQVWEKPWEHFREHKIKCDDDNQQHKFEVTTTRRRRSIGSGSGIPGGPVEINKDDERINGFLTEGLTHLDSKSSSDKRLKHVEVLSATSQVVAGSLYKIKAKVALSDCQKSEKKDLENCIVPENAPSKVCEFQIWEKLWEHFREHTIKCDDDNEQHKFEVTTTRRRRDVSPGSGVPGGPVEINKDDERINGFLTEGLTHLDSKSSSDKRLKHVEVLSATSQVVAGALYKIKAKVALSDCKKSEKKDLKSCKVPHNSPSKVCEFQVWEKPWEHFREHKIKCDDDNQQHKFEVTTTRRRRSIGSGSGIPGGPVEINKDDERINGFLTEGLTHLDSKSSSDKRLKHVEVLSATSQVVAGSLYKIKAKVALSDCKKNEKKDLENCNVPENAPSKVCEFQIWEKLWEHFREHKIKCDDDNEEHKFEVTTTRRRRAVGRGVPGGEFEVSHDKVQEYLNGGLDHLDSQSNHKNKYKVHEILSATQQVVSGQLFRIKAKVVLSDCLKTDSTEREKCQKLESSEPQICNFKIWDQPWLPNGRETNITCEDKSYSYRQRRDVSNILEFESPLSSEEINQFLIFNSFIEKYGKTYHNTEEFQIRFRVFQKNLENINLLNTLEQGTAKYGITRFADLTSEEFSQSHGLRQDLRSENDLPLPEAKIPNIEIPVEFDWRKKGVVSEVKNQGQCGSCWAFSVTGNIEGQYAITHGKLLEFSEQELVDCDTEDQGCNGGLMDTAYRVIEKLGGLETEQDYPYDAEDEKCHFNKSLARAQVTGALNISQDETDMAKWLVKNGPISIAINANAMQFYLGGVSHPFKFLCNPNNLDHGVLIVGYGVHKYPMFKKNLPYWIVKNSWGASWGEQGYYRVYRGDGTCGVNQTPSSAIVA